MTTFIVLAVVLIGGWLGFRMLKKKAAKARDTEELPDKQTVLAYEQSLPREELAKARAKAANKVADLKLRELEKFYFYEELKRK